MFRRKFISMFLSKALSMNLHFVADRLKIARNMLRATLYLPSNLTLFGYSLFEIVKDVKLSSEDENMCDFKNSINIKFTNLLDIFKIA
jgi:hypothetical protein